MKKILLGLLFCIVSSPVWALQIPQTENYILNTDPQQVINTQGINDPLRDGAYKLVNDGTSTTGIVTSAEITDHQSAQNATLDIIKNIVNYALGLLSLIALVYLVYNGFLILSAAGDDTQYKKGLKSIKNAMIALAGIGASRLIVSFIFYLLHLVI